MRDGSRLSIAWEMAAVLLVVLLAGTLRFYRLPEVPPGLHFDEGFKGVTARGILEGAPPQLFFESDMGEEPIAMYLVTVALGLAGREPWVIRLPSAVMGTLTVLLAWWLGREFFYLYQPGRVRQRDGVSRPPADTEAGLEKRTGQTGLREQILGLITAMALAILYWHLSFSRIGMEPILVPFFATLAFAALLRGLNTEQWPWFVLVGLGLGGSLYTYKAGYFVPLVAALFVLCAIVVERGFSSRYGRRLLLMGLVSLLVAAPIAIYFATHPANFLQRPASVALAGSEGTSSEPWSELAGNVPRVLGMFFLQGDANPRSNLPGRPALDPFLAILFLVGLGRSLADSLRGQATAALALIWLGVMVLPTLVTGDAPHFGRSIGATPALALLCALGAWTLWQAVARLDRQWLKVAVVLVLVAGFLFSGVSTARAYFLNWGRSPDLFYAYDVGLAEIAEYANSLHPNQDVYLTPTSSEHYTLEYLAHHPLGSFDGRAGLVLPPPDREAVMIVLTREDGATLPALTELRPDGEITWTLADGFGRPYAAAYRLPPFAGEAASPGHQLEATFGDAVRLLGYSVDGEVVSPGDSLNLTLYWQSLKPLDSDYTAFTHLLGGHNPDTAGPLWAGHDSQPNQGHYPTTSWRAGEVILDIHPLTVPADAPPGEYQLEAGMYLLDTLERLPAADAMGKPIQDNAVVLGSIQVEN